MGNIHIVSGGSENTLIQSKVIDLNNNRIISLYDDLGIGPLCDVGMNQRISERQEWIHNIFPYFDEVYSLIQNDIDTIQTIVRDASEVNKIYLWLGYSSREIIQTARLMHHISKLNKPVYIANYPNIPLKNYRGETIFPKILGTTALHQIQEVWEQFKPILPSEYSAWEAIWNQAKEENSLLRVLDGNGTVTGKNVDYFDHVLLSHCQPNFQKAARVVGETLVDIDFATGDLFLGWRLIQLAEENKIETTGELLAMRDFSVKSVSKTNEG